MIVIIIIDIKYRSKIKCTYLLINYNKSVSKIINIYSGFLIIEPKILLCIYYRYILLLFIILKTIVLINPLILILNL